VQDKANSEDFSSQTEPSEEQAFDWIQTAPSLSSQNQPKYESVKKQKSQVSYHYKKSWQEILKSTCWLNKQIDRQS